MAATKASVRDVVGGAVAALGERERDSQAEYLEAVSRVGRGQTVPADELAEAVAAAGKTAVEFAADAGRVASRVELRRRLDSVPGLRAKQAERQAAADATTRKLDEVREQAVKEIKALLAERDALDAEIQTGLNAEGELIRSCTDPELLAADQRIGEEMLALQRHIPHLLEAKQGELAAVAAFREQARESNSEEGWRHFQKKVDEADAAAVAREEEIASAYERYNALRAERAAIDRKKLEV